MGMNFKFTVGFQGTISLEEKYVKGAIEKYHALLEDSAEGEELDGWNAFATESDSPTEFILKILQEGIEEFLVESFLNEDGAEIGTMEVEMVVDN